MTPLAWRQIYAGYFPHSTKARPQSPPKREKMLSSKENIADVQVQQIQSKAQPHDSGKEEGKLATMSVSEEAIEI